MSLGGRPSARQEGPAQRRARLLAEELRRTQMAAADRMRAEGTLPGRRPGVSATSRQSRSDAKRYGRLRG